MFLREQTLRTSLHEVGEGLPQWGHMGHGEGVKVYKDITKTSLIKNYFSTIKCKKL